MIALDLSGWLTLEVYRTLLVFSRISAAFLLLPGFGEPAVPARMRVMAGLAIAFSVAGAVPGLPVSVPGAWGTLLAVVGEAFSGALLGTLARTIVSGILIAGQVIGQNIGLGNIFAQGMAIDQAATVGAALYAGLIARMAPPVPGPSWRLGCAVFGPVGSSHSRSCCWRLYSTSRWPW
jgi:flagellar biosynthetic protein FliR